MGRLGAVEDTELLGGMPFRTTNPGAKPVVGFRYSMGSWAGKTGQRDLDPLFSHAAATGSGRTVVAREGYAVGALEVDADQYASAVRVVFMRLSAEGQLDKTDSYTSDWIGSPSGAPTKTLGGTGAQVLRVFGRKAAMLDAVGLTLQNPDP